MLVSSDSDFVSKIRKLSYFGIDKQAFQRYTKRGSWFYQVEGPGFKCNMDNIHAAIGRVQQLNLMNLQKRDVKLPRGTMNYYQRLFKGLFESHIVSIVFIYIKFYYRMN